MSMHGKRRILAIASSVVLAGGGLAAWLVPATSASAGNVQIQVFDAEGPYEKVVDVGKPGFSPGDHILESHPLLDPADGSTVGRDFTRLEVMKVLHGGEDFLLLVDFTARLADGDIVVSGPIRFSQFTTGGTLSVIGGTGAYELARGTVSSTGGEVGGTEGVILSFDLTTT